MEENRKRSGDNDAGEFAGKRARTPATSHGRSDKSSEDEDMMAWLCIDEEAVSELAKLLETEVTSPVKVKFIDDPYSSALIFQSSSSYVTINGNEELCGSSFSDSESSVMASIDMGSMKFGRRGPCFEAFPPGEGGAWGLDVGAADEECGEVNGTYGCDLDDEMLAKFLGEDLFQ